MQIAKQGNLLILTGPIVEIIVEINSIVVIVIVMSAAAARVRLIMAWPVP